jgi:hypothetical protein
MKLIKICARAIAKKSGDPKRKKMAWNEEFKDGKWDCIENAEHMPYR